MTGGLIDPLADTIAVCDETGLDAVAAAGWRVTRRLDPGTRAGRLLLALTADADTAAIQQAGDVTVCAAWTTAAREPPAAPEPPWPAPDGPDGRPAGRGGRTRAPSPTAATLAWFRAGLAERRNDRKEGR